MCKLCESQPVYEFTNQRKLCRVCFVRWFEKKFLYTVRRFGMIGREDVLAYENKGDFRGVVLENLLKMFSERSLVKVIKLPSNKSFTKKALGDTLDITSDRIIKDVVKGKIKDLENVRAVDGKVIRPLYLFLDQEILLYAQIKKLKFKKSKETKDKWYSFIESLEKKHPEIKRAIVNSYLELYS